MSFTSPSPSGRPSGRPSRSPSRHPSRRRLTSGLVAAALVALGSLASVATAPTASAHDELVRTVPADGSAVATAPDQVVLTFSESPIPVGLEVKVTGPTGDVQQGTAAINGTDVVQPLLPSAPAGTYRVAWRATSEDGHANSGELSFTAGAANARAATATPGAGEQTPPASPSSASSTPSTEPATTPSATTAPATAPAVGSAPTSAQTSSGTSPVAIAVIVVVLLVLAGIAVALRRRSSGSGTTS